jgi:DNA recombination protein RmuC
MLIAVAALQIAVLLAVVALFFRRSGPVQFDPRLAQLPEQLSRLDGRADALDVHIRSALDSMRRELATEAQTTRYANAAASTALRAEVATSITNLGTALNTGLEKFRADAATSSSALRTEVEQKMHSISQGFSGFKEEINAKHSALKQSLSEGLVELMGSNNAHQDKLRNTVEQSLAALNKDNSDKLEQMRATVDEKLQATLNKRLTDSFGQVTTHLGEVQKGLGEMKELATGVGDLKKVLTNVSRRGGLGEFLVGQQLEEMFSPEQYLKQANIKPNTSEAVDYALKFPNGSPGDFVLLPIDSKFPTADWEKLEHAYDHGTPDEIAFAGKAFERGIRSAAKSICEKYIDPPTTTPHAIMVLPTEGLYAEVVRRPGLQSDIQNTCCVTIAGPSTFRAILTSFQMGFQMLNLQKKGDDVWKVLSKAKSEFGNFGTLMNKVERQVGTVQNTLREINSKTTTINRALKSVSDSDSDVASTNLFGFEDLPPPTFSIAASVEED